MDELRSAYECLAKWCRVRGFAGHDPFDGLNSRVFQATPLRHSRVARLVWTQAFKRSPVNLRVLARVPVERNSKGTALFALARLADFRARRTKEAEREARALLDDLVSSRLSGWSGAAWGYNFDWQGRAFYAPKNTPTIVPTAFAARAFIEAASAFGDEEYLKTARSACEFILRDLRRSEESGEEGAGAEVCWSYTPIDTTRVLNASLLAAETLASVAALTGEEDLREWAVRGARYVVRRQRADGSWAYGADGYQSWADNFHTAFVLTSLSRIIETCNNSKSSNDDGGDVAMCRNEFIDAIRRGYEFWRERFFLADGWPKYYHDKLYPADAHSAGAAIVALVELRWLDSDALKLAEKIARWAINELRNERGFFYYQRRRFYIVRTPYMRWSQAWMLYALARLLEARDLQF